eukprot:evm.model.scf_238EXC.13 EVM.evm.TU.scf_238EXC.13   scf_238EXC:112229-115052(+)
MAEVAGPSPFHPGEAEVQEAVGGRHHGESIGRQFIRPYMPDQHREFFASQRIMYAGTVDNDGRPWASAIVGKPGFVTAPDDKHLRISPIRPYAGDRGNFGAGGFMGLLGLDLSNRRRNRANGAISEAREGGILLNVDQSFGNCPKYITVRRVVVDVSGLEAMGQAKETTTGTALGPEQMAMIRKADIFFIASAFGGPVGPGSRSSSVGADVSHRGGPPGFVRVVDASTLRWPDYVGNGFFNTLGNIAADPRCGLLFVDYATGDALQVSGRATILFEERDLPGAQRTVEFRAEEFSHVRGALPLTVEGEAELSPYNPSTAEEVGSQMVECVSVKDEAQGVKTFEFRLPEGEGGKPASYLPGQFATFDLRIPDSSPRPVNRTWTVSSNPRDSRATGTFTITVKKIGLASSWLHNRMAPGMSIAFKGFGGDFTPLSCQDCDVRAASVVLVAGGIGITPLRSMLKEFERAGTDVHVLYSTRTSAEAAFLDEISETAERSGGRIRLTATVTGDDPGWGGLKGRVDEAFLSRHIPDLCDREVYLCGPQGFMNSVTAALERKGCGAEA